MKKLFVLIAAWALVLGILTGCGGGQPSSAPTPEKGNEIELVLWHNRSGTNGETVDALVEEYNSTIGAENGVKVVSVRQDDSIVSTFKTLLYAKDMENMPDLATLYAGDVEYASTVSCIEPLDERMANDPDFHAEDMVQSLMSTYNYQGTQYSLPFHGDTMIMYYNKTAFEKAGLDPETPPTTIEEMAACAEKLLIKEGETVKQYAITLGLQNCYLNNWIANQGDVYYLGNNEAGRTGRMTEVTFDKDGTMLTLLNEWQKVLDTGAVQSVDSGDQPKDEFISGLSAMFIGGNWAMTSIEEGAAETGFELGVCPMPKVRESDIGGSCPGGTSLYMINKGSKDRTDAAWDFMKWWTSAETQAKFCMKTKYIPVNAKALADQEIQTWLKENPQYSVAFDVLSQSDPRIQEQLAPTQQEFQTIFQDTCLQWANGELTAEQCVQIMADKCNAALDEFNAANPVG